MSRYTQYQFRVTAESRFGLGEPLVSEICRAENQCSKLLPYFSFFIDILNDFSPNLFLIIYLATPRQPGCPRVMGATKDSVSLAWEEPAQDGGSAVTGYYVEKKEKHSVLWQRDSEESIASKSYTVTGILSIP